MEFATKYTPIISSRGPIMGPSQTQEHFQRDCDINYMIRRAIMGDNSVLRAVRYGDFRDIPDLHEASNKMALANSVWEELPETVRASVGSPSRLVAIIDSQESTTTVSDTKPSDTVTPSKTDGAKPSDGEVHA